MQDKQKAGYGLLVAIVAPLRIMSTTYLELVLVNQIGST